MIRILNKLVGDTVDKLVVEGKHPIVIYEAPTGYGKTTSSINFYRVLREYGITSGLIHVLPMRSIATELYCKVVNSISSNEVEHCNDVGEDPTISKIIRDLNINRDDVGYQFMDFIDPSKSLYFLKSILITTFNSFFHNLARFPVGELGKYRRHYEVPRTSIFTSGIVLDEAHLYGGDPGSGDERSLFTAFIVGIKALAEARVPLLIESATLPKQLIDIMMDTIKGVGITPYLISFKYGTKCEEAVKSGNILECHDDDYVAKCLDINWMTEVIEDDKVVEVVKNHISVGHKVLIVRNTVDKAVKTYLKLREMFDDVEIIHGRFTKRDRAEKLRKCRAARLVVSTQVIEAGVNISFNVLITDAASPSSIVQRAGRVLRLFEDRDAYVYVVKSDGDGVYDKSVTTNFVSKLGEITKDSRHIIDWRIPSNGLINHNSRISFIKLLNEAYQGLELTIDPKRYVRFLDVISLPITTQKDLNKVYEESKGLVYSSILFPVYVYEKPPNTLNDLMENSVPLSLNFINNHLSKILKINGDYVSVLVFKCSEDLSNCSIDEDQIPKKFLKEPIKLTMVSWSRDNQILTPLSFIASPEVYTSITGLVV